MDKQIEEREPKNYERTGALEPKRTWESTVHRKKLRGRKEKKLREPARRNVKRLTPGGYGVTKYMTRKFFKC